MSDKTNEQRDKIIEKLVHQLADYYFMNAITRPQIDENAMDLLDEIAACGYETEVKEALGVHNECA